MKEAINKSISLTESKNPLIYSAVNRNGLEQLPLGGAGAVQIMEQLIAGGVKEIIAAGCCGDLVEDTEGSFFVPAAALRQEGTSYHYLLPSREIELDAAPKILGEKVVKWCVFRDYLEIILLQCYPLAYRNLETDKEDS